MTEPLTRYTVDIVTRRTSPLDGSWTSTRSAEVYLASEVDALIEERNLLRQERQDWAAESAKDNFLLQAEVARLTRELAELRTRSDAPFNCINCERGITQDTWKWLGGRNIGPFCELCHDAIEAERAARPRDGGAG